MKNFLISVSLLYTLFSGAQTNFDCGTDYEDIPQLDYRLNSETSYANWDTKYVINTFVHIINDDNGQNNTPSPIIYGENEVMEILRILNKNFNPANIFFKYRGFQIVNNTVLTNNGNINNMTLAGNLNIFLMNDIGGYSGIAVQGGRRMKIPYATLEGCCAEYALVHETGHCFNLLHTFNLFNIVLPDPLGNDCEHVTRDPENSQYNAESHGDKVADTPAQPPLGASAFSNCQYIYNPSLVDCQGTPFENIVPNNFMSYSVLENCSYHFTPGQILKMRNYLESPTASGWSSVFNTVDSLYDPFEVTDIPHEVISIDDNGDGTAEICYNIQRRHRFQKSFDYDFYNTFGGDPVNASSFDLPVVQENTSSFKVRINQIDNSRRTIVVDCTREVICQTENFIGGTIITTEFLGSSNLTIRDLNELEVKDPQLFQELLQQRYHIIRKLTQTGKVYQILVYKE